MLSPLMWVGPHERIIWEVTPRDHPQWTPTPSLVDQAREKREKEGRLVT
jgi:hypothetical protein